MNPSLIIAAFFCFSVLTFISAQELTTNSTSTSTCPWYQYCGPDNAGIMGAGSACVCSTDTVCGPAPWYNCLTCAECPTCGGCVKAPSTSTPTATPAPSPTSTSLPDPGTYNMSSSSGCYCRHPSSCGPDSCGITGPTSQCQCASGHSCSRYPTFQCLAPGISPPASGVDFVIWQPTAQQSIMYETIPFDTTSCAWQEKIILFTGARKLLRFSTQIHNLGTQNFLLGNPTDPQNTELFVWSPCHAHYHLFGWTHYSLTDSTGAEVGVGHKQGFCLRDTVRVNALAGDPITTCENQGISANWGDLYSSATDGQWIDITGLASGAYTLTMCVNPNQVFPESNYDNNCVIVNVQIP